MSSTPVSLARAAPSDIARLKDQVEPMLAQADSLEQAAQTFVTAVRHMFVDDVVLARMYVAMPLSRLPARERAFADGLALSKGLSDKVVDETMTLTLLGTDGALPAWCDRRRSQGHIAIPLAGGQFVASVPMVAALLQALGVDLTWLDVPRDVFARRLVGGFNGVFYVADASTTVDAQQRLVIPAQDFVAQHSVRSVFGVGGAYLNGWIAGAILFTTAVVPQDRAALFTPLATVFKLATMHLIASGRIFAR